MESVRPWHQHYGLKSVLIIGTPDFEQLTVASRLPIGMVMMELDGVPGDRKAEARATLVRALRELDWRGKLTFVRASTLDSGYFEDDIAALAPALPTGFVLPKPHGPDDIKHADDVMSRVEKECDIAPGAIKIGAMIERIRALQHIDQIATASPRMFAFLLGLTDLSYEVGYRRTLDGDGLESYWVRARVLMAAHLAGLIAVDTATLRFEDPELTYEQARMGYRMGFDARFCVTPSQVEPVNRAFSPTETEIAWAERIVANSDGAFDEPMIARARGILQPVRR